jgi:predicted TIM-barrel fold metal-dependent hydrolase
MPVDQNWLARTVEEVLEPALPIVDPHHHLWAREGDDYLAKQLRGDVGAGHNVVATVFVECMSEYFRDGPEALRPVGETVFVDRFAEENGDGLCAGIVGFADLTMGGAVDEVLAAHRAASPKRFRGIRHAMGWDASDAVRNSHTKPPRHLAADPTFREGIARLPAFDMTFEAWLYHTQINELIALARAVPEVTIVLDHFGGPLGIGPYEERRKEIVTQWKTDIAALAACPNVVAKLGGINMPINGFGWHKSDKPPSSDDLVTATGDYYRHAIDCFGPDRCMFESNFPVDKISCSYVVVWNAFKKIAKGYSADEKAMLFHDTAARVYRLA